MSTRILVAVFTLAAVFSGAARRQSSPLPRARRPRTCRGTTSRSRSASDFPFAVVSDNSGGMRPGIFKDAVGKVNLLQPLVCHVRRRPCRGIRGERGGVRTQFDELSSEIGVAGRAVFRHRRQSRCLSAHDARLRHQPRYGRPYYSFVYGDVLFVVLDTQDGPERPLSRRG